MRASSNLIGSRRKLGSGIPSDLVTQFADSYEKSFLVIVFEHVRVFFPSFPAVPPLRRLY